MEALPTSRTRRVIRLMLIAGLLLIIWAAVNLVPVLRLGLRNISCEAKINTAVALGDMRDAVMSRLDQSMATMVGTAQLATLLVPSLHDCWLETATEATFDPKPLISFLMASDTNLLQGVGVITAPYIGGAQGFNTSNKISFEVTDGSIVSPACPDYLYGFTTSDGLNYQSYCVSDSGIVNYAYSPYSGPDYGLSQEEINLLQGRTKTDFLPVFGIVGRQSLSYEVAWTCNATSDSRAYGIAFAQTNLLLLSDYLQAMQLDGITFVVERDTGLLVACNIADQVVTIGTTSYGTKEQLRVAALNATDAGIREVASVIENLKAPATQYESKNYVVFTQPYEYPLSGSDLGWLIVAAYKRASLVQVAKSTSSQRDVVIPIVLGLFVILCVKVMLDAIDRLMKPRMRNSESVQPLQPESL